MASRTISTPNPDPTALTTEQTNKSIAALEKLFEAKLIALKDVMETRLGAMDKAVILLQSANSQTPEKISDAVSQLREIHEEKFSSVAVQFKERDTRSEQTAKDAKVAIDAALQAQKEAVGEQNKSNAAAISKSETAFMKQIEQQAALIAAVQKGSDEKINDAKERITVMESQKKGGSDAWALVAAGIGGIIAFLSVMVAIITLVMKK
jgi:hypothetical protein